MVRKVFNSTEPKPTKKYLNTSECWVRNGIGLSITTTKPNVNISVSLYWVGKRDRLKSVSCLYVGKIK